MPNGHLKNVIVKRFRWQNLLFLAVYLAGSANLLIAEKAKIRKAANNRVSVPLDITIPVDRAGGTVAGQKISVR
jgi:hypothetical protein